MFTSLGADYSRSQDRVWQDQAPFLRDVYGIGRPLFDMTSQPAMDAAQGIADQAMPFLSQGMQSLASIANPQAQIDQQSAALQQGLGTLFREEINPALESNAIAAGGFGGRRQGVVQGMEAGRIANAYGQGLAQIMANANSVAGQAATALPGFGESMMNLGLAPFQAAWAPAMNYGQLVGGPTVLNEREGGGFKIGFG